MAWRGPSNVDSSSDGETHRPAINEDLVVLTPPSNPYTSHEPDFTKVMEGS